MKRSLLFFFWSGLSVLAQEVVPPAMSDATPGANGTQPIISEPAKPVMIDGKPASELTEQQMLDFLQSKIKTITQEDGELLPLRVAPGYALKLMYQEPIMDAVPGDPALCTLTKVGSRILVFNAKQRAGDTNLSVFFAGGVVRQYHIFIEANFSTADDFFRVLAATEVPETGVGGPSGASSASMFLDASGEVNGSNLTNLINNYDALVSERSVDTNRIRRREVFRRGSGNAWTYYYVFDFANGSAAVSFRYRNPGRMEAVFTPGRVRIQIGAMIFTPDFAAVDKEYIGQGQSAIGYVFFKKPAFSLNQPFDLVWSRQ
jgi:hypothetical protein